MVYRRSDDLWAPLALLSLGLLTPGFLWALAGEFLIMYGSAVQLTLVLTAAYGLVAWFLIDRGTIDRTSFLLVSLMWPWPLLFAALIVLLLINQGEPVPRGPLATVFRAITTDWPGSLIGYGTVFAVTGVIVFVLSRRYEALLRRGDRLPSPSRLIPVIVAVLLVLVTVATGVNTVTSQSASIEHVGPGTRDYHDPTFNVTVAGPPVELRVEVTAPDGTTVTKRVSRAEMRGGTGTVPIELEYGDSVAPDELPVRDGNYRVRVTSLAGRTVDTATFDAGDAVDGSLTVVPIPNESLPWSDDPFVYTERNAGDIWLGFTITNDGAFHAEMSLILRVPEDPIVFDNIPMAPGDRHGVLFKLAPETVTTIRANTDGRVTAELYTSAYRDDPVATSNVTLPSNSG